MAKLSQLLNYCATNPDAAVGFTVSGMLLAVKSNASHLSVVKACLHAAGCFYLTSMPAKPVDALQPNGAVHVSCHIMRDVLSSAAKAKLVALFHDGKDACPLRIALKEMGHPQQATPTATENETSSCTSEGA
jgi:hypothetical protein